LFESFLLLVFVVVVVGLIFSKMYPRDTSVLKTLASNRLRIKFAEPAEPRHDAETHFRKLNKLLDESGYVTPLIENAVQELDHFLVEDSQRVNQFLEVYGALILLCKFIGVNGFQLSNYKRTPQHYRNLDATIKCLRTITKQREGLEHLLQTNDSVYDIYVSLSYAQTETNKVSLEILRDVLNVSETGYQTLLTSAEDYMYIPGDEEYMFAHLVNRLLSHVDSTDDLELQNNEAILSFLEALLTSPHGGDKQKMVRKLLRTFKVAEKLEVFRKDERLTPKAESVISSINEGEELEPNFHTTPFEKRTCYCHQFASRVRWFSRMMNCLFTTLPGVLPIGTGALRKFSDEFRQQSEDKMTELKMKKRTGEYTPKEIQKFNREMSALTLGVGSDFFDHMMESGMFSQTRKFIDQAEKVENWNHEELLQAGRNVWTCFGLEMILYQQNVNMSDAYLGYSLLYPYTDNYLDDDSITPADKKVFQDLFTRRLAGENVPARSEAEQKIWNCVSLIENRFNRKEFPNAFNSLIAINEAQTKSLKQHTKSIPPEELIVEISMEKGGTSVLADGYLVQGDMTEEDALFAFGLGVALQLVDDLQDTSRDIAVHQHTMFTVPFLKKEPSDARACRLIQLMQVMVDPAHYNNLDENGNKLRFAMLKMTNTIAIKAIAKYCYIFTEEFVEDVAQCSPIFLSNLSRVNNMARMLQMVRSNQI